MCLAVFSASTEKPQRSDRMKRVLILSSSPRKNGNSQMLCEQFRAGAEAAGNQVQLVRLAEKRLDSAGPVMHV